MTFIDPAQHLPFSGHSANRFDRLRRLAAGTDRRRVGDEDGARKALGNDPTMPPASMAGASLEHLARIALG